MPKYSKEKLAVVWEPGDRPDESNVLLLFDMLFPAKTPHNLTSPIDGLSLKDFPKH
jgi:hypothetical protein